MPQFKPLKQTRISEEVLRQLKEAILVGQFKSEGKLPSERELTEQFQVSRGVIREAIRALEITGFVTTRQGNTGGAFVTELSFNHVGNAFLDLFLADKVSIPEMAQVRRIIEPQVARLAAVNIAAEGEKALTTAQKAEFIAPESHSERITVIQRVHLVLAEICGNRFLEAIVKSMLRLTREVVEAVEPDHLKLHAPGEHRHIIEAVINGNGTAAAEAMAEHLEDFSDRLFQMEKVYRAKAGQEVTINRSERKFG
jgi:GntR family transcriptional repressor for pyruvate dehydrogenase complex